MSTAPDTEAAVAAYLYDEIGDMVGGHIFRPELNTTGLSMPEAAIVVRPAGGYVMYGGSTQRLGDPRVDILCYGSTRLESQNLARAVLLAMKRLERRVFEDTLLHWARVSGLVPIVDPSGTEWPLTIVSCQVLHGEVALT